jgi:hypothetical protein
MAELVSNVEAGLVDLSAMPLTDLPRMPEAMLEIAIDKLIQPCTGLSNLSGAGERTRIWQNYSTP